MQHTFHLRPEFLQAYCFLYYQREQQEKCHVGSEVQNVIRLDNKQCQNVRKHTNRTQNKTPA